jgi:hypothetical protein
MHPTTAQSTTPVGSQAILVSRPRLTWAAHSIARSCSRNHGRGARLARSRYWVGNPTVPHADVVADQPRQHERVRRAPSRSRPSAGVRPRSNDTWLDRPGANSSAAASRATSHPGGRQLLSLGSLPSAQPGSALYFHSGLDARSRQARGESSCAQWASSSAFHIPRTTWTRAGASRRHSSGTLRGRRGPGRRRRAGATPSC